MADYPEYKNPTYAQLVTLRRQKWSAFGYAMIFWKEYDFSRLDNILTGRQRHGETSISYNDIIIMADTETSKSSNKNVKDNHICAWTISARAYGVNLFTLWGQKPSEMITCFSMLVDSMHGDKTLVYWHNMSYDWQFIKKFCFDKWDYPIKQLNTKPLYPISIEFENGVIFRDSLILAQRSLEKWAEDLDVEHKKAVGYWDYDQIRNQNTWLNPNELTYIEHDTLAGVECLDAMRIQLNKKIWQMPYTATGIVRQDVINIGRSYRAKDRFNRAVPTLDQYLMLEKCFHGGYVHANRHNIGWPDWAVCYDFASSYPYVMLTEKMPIERFIKIPDCTLDNIFWQNTDYSFMFKLVLIKPQLKDRSFPMPALQYSKCVNTLNAVLDNGRVLAADYLEIYVTDIDASVIAEQYDYYAHKCVEVWTARKDYLPRWLTDYIYDLFVQKCQLKAFGCDPVAYALIKAKLNSIYGLTVQHSIQEEIKENYETGEFYRAELDIEEEYNKYKKRRSSILLYQWGVWITSYAFRNLFNFGKCVPDDELWLYSDTDSCYATAWNDDKLKAYNQNCMDKLTSRGYGAVNVGGRDYWLGVAELDGTYSEFVSLGAKRYACRDAATGQLKITVAGVPKKTGVKCLNGDIRNFKKGLIFDGETTGKLTHEYINIEEIYTDAAGNEIGDSVNLYPCDYRLDETSYVDWTYFDYEEIYIQTYEAE